MMLVKKTNSDFYLKSFIVGLLFLTHNSLIFAQLSVKADRENKRYDLGESMTFRVSGAANGTINYEIKNTLIDTLRLFGSGTAAIVNGAATIPFTATEAGFVICKIKQNADSAYTGASFSPEKLQPSEAEPADFDAFWAAQKAAVRAVPLDMNLTYIRTNTYAFGSMSNVFSFDIAIIDGRRAYGYMVVPVSVHAPYPAVIMMPSFGHVANLVTEETSVAERAGVITFFLSPHNNPPNVTSTATEYLTDGLASPSTYYIRYPLLGAVKLMDYLQTRADFNGQVGVLGISQGGGLAALTAGIDNRVTLLMEAYSGFSHQVGAKYSKPSAFPYAYHTAFTPQLSRETIVNTTKYFDPVFALRRFKGVSWNVTSLKDDVCPPHAVMTAFNQVKGQKITQVLFEKLHTSGPDEFYSSEIPNSIYAFMRRHFPKTKLAPWPFNPTTTGYVISAGKDTIFSGNTLNLRGFVGINDAELTTLPVRWEKIEGPANVTFASPNTRNTTATFTQTGTYRLRFTADDFSTVADKKYFILSNDIVVTVNALIPIELVNFSGTIKDKTNELTWTTATEINNKGFNIERSEDAKRWQRLDFIKGAGNSSQLNTYNFTDEGPLSINYYRLRQIDFNGDFKYSNTIALIRYDRKEVVVFPNPASDLLTIRMDKADDSEIRIYDILGKTMLVENTKTNETTINISELIKGNYFIEIKNGQLVTTKKFIKN